jgi:6-phosphogluconate dehydrogenase
MQLGLIGLGRMGSNMSRRLMRGGHQMVVFDKDAATMQGLHKDGATAANSLDDFIQKLAKPRAVWMMVPAAVVDSMVQELSRRMEAGDTIIDGGNSYYIDDIRRAKDL